MNWRARLTRLDPLGRRALLQASIAAGGALLARTRTDGGPRPTRLDARDYGVRGNGVADDTAGLQRAFAAAGAANVPLLLPAGDYLVTRTLRASSNLTLSAYGATLLTAVADLGDSGRLAPTLLIQDVAGVTVSGLGIDGRGAEFPDTEFKPCVSVDGATGVLIEDGTFVNAKGDGLSLADLRPGVHNAGVTVRRTACLGNYRLGLAVMDVDGASFDACVFNDNHGTAPASGVDIEPHFDESVVSNVVFSGCEMSGNGVRGSGGPGFLVSLRPDPVSIQGGVRLVGCTIRGNGVHGVIVYHGRDLEFDDCTVTDNGESGIGIFRTSRNIAIRGGTIAGNDLHGVTAVRDPGQDLAGLEIRDVEILNNSQDLPANYDGIHLQGSVRDVVIAGCTISGGHRYGVWTDGLREQIRLDENELSGNDRGPLFPPNLAVAPRSGASGTSSTPAVAGLKRPEGTRA